MLMTFLLASNDVRIPSETKQMLSKTFKMKALSKASFVLGMEIHRDWFHSLLDYLRTLILIVVKLFNMDDCSLGGAPFVNEDKISK